MNKSGISFFNKIREVFDQKKVYRNPARRENLETGEFGRKLYRNPVRREETGKTGDSGKKVVPESGTQRGNEEQQRNTEESCTGIRYVR